MDDDGDEPYEPKLDKRCNSHNKNKRKRANNKTASRFIAKLIHVLLLLLFLSFKDLKKMVTMKDQWMELIILLLLLLFKSMKILNVGFI